MTLVLSAADVERLLTPDVAIESADRAFRSLALGDADLAEKVLFEGGDGYATSLVYAARASAGAPVATKLVSVSPDNPERGLPLISATVLLTDPVTGLVQAMLDGTSLTTLRTAAASALSVRLLAGPESAVLAIIGSGVQARAHVHAIRHGRELVDTRIWSPDAAHREACAADLGGEARAVSSAAEAIAGADVIACCTHSAEPVLHGAKVPADYLRRQGFGGDNPWERWANATQDEDGTVRSGWFLKYSNRPARIPEQHSETPYITRRAMETGWGYLRR